MPIYGTYPFFKIYGVLAEIQVACRPPLRNPSGLMRVLVRVPASTTNFGPGFDCFGAALNLANQIEVSKSEPAEPLPALFDAAGSSFFRSSSVKPFSFTARVSGEVPVARGLGSSVTLRLGLVLGLNRLAEEPLNREQILALVTELEGHPDNAAAALAGGFTIVADSVTRYLRFPIADRLRFVLFVPDFEVRTDAARQVLPKTYPRGDVVANLGRVGIIAAAMATEQYELLGEILGDYLHQPYRLPLVPFLTDVIKAGRAAGALGGFLSGSGSTIICLTQRDADGVASVMSAAAKPATGQTFVLAADNQGATII
ncbi:MAG: homoserine kinase [Verrucomicrobia bacterium]|nr:homoserine kinase [Verrucomicrobiota bacterium]